MSGLEQKFYEIIDMTKGIGLIIAILALVVTGIIFMTGGAQGGQKGKSMLLYICIGIMLIGFAPSIVTFFAG